MKLPDLKKKIKNYFLISKNNFLDMKLPDLKKKIRNYFLISKNNLLEMKLPDLKVDFISSFCITGLISASFFYIIGRQRYIVQSDFAVRKSGSSELSTGLTSFFGGQNKGSLEDAGYLMSYLKSNDVLKFTNEELDFEKSYLKKGPDIFAGLSKNSSVEDKLELFKKVILLNLNIDSGILTLKTIAYDPETAFSLNKLLLIKAEHFINKINFNINKKQLNFAEQEKIKSQKRVNIARNDLINFKEKNGFLDIKSEVRTSNSLISSLELQLSRKKIELAQIKRKFINDDAPEIIYLEDELEELKNQIANERLLRVSPEGKALNKKSAELSKLESEFELANALYESTQTTIEQTRVDSIRQQRFITLISDPIYPEKEWFYWRHKAFVSSLLFFVIGYVLTKFILGMTENEDG